MAEHLRCTHHRAASPLRLTPATYASIQAALMLFVFWWASAVSALTVDDFDTTGTPYSPCQFAGLPGPTELAGGPTGNFLRLATTPAVNNNTIAYDRTDPGLFSEITVEFDFRITPRVGRADGFGFALLNTAVAAYGNGGPVCPPPPRGIPEEPNFIQSLGIGFDIYRSADLEEETNNHVSIHWDGALVDHFDIDLATLNLASGQWIHAAIIIQPGDGAVAGDVSITLTPTDGQPITIKFLIPGFKAYEGRVFFGARSGGESADHDVDNIRVEFSGLPDPAIYGQWSEPIDADIIPIHAMVLPTGKVLYWTGREGEDGGDPSEVNPRLWDPTTDIISEPAFPGYNIFCSGHAFLADGRVFVAGGHIDDFVGAPQASIYDPFIDTWTQVSDMNAGRWYPTNITLANGEVLAVSGQVTFEDDLVNDLPQVWQSAEQLWRNLDAARFEMHLYPFMFLASDGRVFNVGANDETNILNPFGTGGWAFDQATSRYGIRTDGSAAMYDTDKVLIVGGVHDLPDDPQPPTNRAEVLDFQASPLSWREVGPMAYARKYHTAVLLPTGQVLVANGTSSLGFNNAIDAVHVAELWDPGTGTWSLLAGMRWPRVYHSIALLLPDGRVLVGGGGDPAPADEEDRRDFELYSPPYLFKGSRPTITAAPITVTYGETFVLQTPDAARIAKVTWIRLPAVTHAFDQNQRLNHLSFSGVSDGLQVLAPAQACVSPPGHYMLFLLDDAGVPSIAHIIQIQLPLPAFVTGFYQYALGRTPTPSEVSTWVGYLEANPTPVGVSTIVHAAFDGPEFRDRPITPETYVTALYRSILGREPEPARLASWATLVLDRLVSILPFFVGSDEFRLLLPDCQDETKVAALVTRLYQEALMREPSGNEVRTWTDHILERCADVEMVVIEEVVEAFFTSEEYLSVPKSHIQYVTILYRSLLARDPEPGGLEQWVNYLVGQLATIEDQFINSAEFQDRLPRLFLPPQQLCSQS